MYREKSWEKGVYIDNHRKYICRDCCGAFIIGEELTKNCMPGYPVCPYCGSQHVECKVFTEDSQLDELSENMGCLAIDYKVPMIIDDLNFSTCTYNCLKRAGIVSVRQLKEMSDEEIMQIDRINRKRFEEIKRLISVNRVYV